MKELDPHNSALIERLKAELKETTSCDASWHSGVNDGMYRLLQYLIENKLIVEKLSGEAKTPDHTSLGLVNNKDECTGIDMIDGEWYDLLGNKWAIVKESVPTPSDEDIKAKAKEIHRNTQYFEDKVIKSLIDIAKWTREQTIKK